MAAITLLRRPATTTSTHKRFALSSLIMSRAQSTLRSYLVTPNELSAALRANAPSKLSTSPKTIPICGSWFLPNDPEKRTGQQVFRASHIPSARFFDLDKVADTSSPYPHMLPSPEVFRDAMRDLGVKRDDTLVVYDTAELGIFSAPRVAWTLRVFGHPSVHLLNNYKLWVEQGHEVEAGDQAPVERTEYPLPQLDASKVVDFKEVRELALDRNKEGREEVQILDARSEGRWKGVDPEPRPGLSSGHIPTSQPVPVPDLLDPKTKTFLSPEKLREVFQRRGVDPEKPIISSCGTGVTATIIDAALTEAGYGDGVRRVYDGSWTEWSSLRRT
jgi:thiosulfate/3-mercaptopyruvate sulfurtransferase